MTAALYKQLRGAGDWSLSPSQLQSAIESRLGPLDDAPDPNAHWRALDGLAAGKSRRLPTADGAAVELAILGFPCWHLAEVIAGVPRWISEHQSSPPDAETTAERRGRGPKETQPEELARELVEAAANGDEGTWFVRRAKVMLGRAVPWGASVGEDANLERRGQAQGVLTGFFEEDLGEPLLPQDPSDEATVRGAPLVDVMIERVVVQPVFDRLSATLRDLTLADLVGGVQMAAAALPLIERTTAPTGTQAERYLFIAAMALLWLEARPALATLSVILGAVEARLQERLSESERAAREAHHAGLADLLSEPNLAPTVEAFMRATQQRLEGGASKR